MTETRRISEAKQIFRNLYSQRITKVNKPNCCINDINYTFKKIQIIDNVAVEVQITSRYWIRENYESMQYDIKCSNIQGMLSNYGEETEYHYLYHSSWFNHDKQSLSLFLVEKLLTDLHDKIIHMKLDRTFGIFVTESCDEDFDEYINGDECCVCYHKTVTKTDCKHHLCIGCWSSMLDNDLLKCPMCKRKHITVYINHYDDDEFDDNEEVGIANLIEAAQLPNEIQENHNEEDLSDDSEEKPNETQNIL